MRHGLLWMSHEWWVIFEWDTNHLWRSHGSRRVCFEGVCHQFAQCGTYQWVMSHESCHSHECVMGYVWISHEWYLNETRIVCEGVMSHVCVCVGGGCMSIASRMRHLWMSRVTPMNESCQKHEWVMPHKNESCLIWITHSCGMYECIMLHVNESCRVWMCQGTYE